MDDPSVINSVYWNQVLPIEEELNHLRDVAPGSIEKNHAHCTLTHIKC